jgi:aminoglycoside phosphotransferase (APT) family kinase protein
VSQAGVENTNEVRDALVRMGLAPRGEEPVFERLTGGVSSDIWKVEVAGQPAFCVKRALAQLRVTQEWKAPVERNGYEIAWMETASAIVPDAVPRILGVDTTAQLFAMEYLDPERYTLWKRQLRDGIAEIRSARLAARALLRIHAATAGRVEIAERFPTDAIFHAIRLEPYLLAAGRRHPDLAAALSALVETTAHTKRTLVHGDVSPKNILIGPKGPVFLDAECAWYGDPAFDVAFCLNHFLLKCLWNPGARDDFLACYDAFAEEYFDRVDWESPLELEERTARLLPGLFLARVDGKSPVEYITAESERERVRRVAAPLLQQPPQRLTAIRDAWRKELAR